MKFFLVMLFLLFRYSEAQNAAVSLLIPGLFAKFFIVINSVVIRRMK